MTKEEVEKTFAGLSPYYAYKQGLQDGASCDWEAFRRNAAKDFVASIVIGNGQDFFSKGSHPFIVKSAICLADELIKQLKEDNK